MSFWSGEKLAANPSVVTGFSSDHVDANAYNLHMGNCYFRTADDLGGEDQKKTTLSPGESFIIPAGQFAFLLTKETVNVPANAMAFISMRTGIKFQGLINVSGFHVDPGYSGKLIYAVYNASPSPVQICEGDPIFKIWFADLDRRSDQRYLFQRSCTKRHQ
jgi:dCTP deaminase